MHINIVQDKEGHVIHKKSMTKLLRHAQVRTIKRITIRFKVDLLIFELLCENFKIMFNLLLRLN